MTDGWWWMDSGGFQKSSLILLKLLPDKVQNTYTRRTLENLRKIFSIGQKFEFNKFENLGYFAKKNISQIYLIFGHNQFIKR